MATQVVNAKFKPEDLANVPDFLLVDKLSATAPLKANSVLTHDSRMTAEMQVKAPSAARGSSAAARASSAATAASVAAAAAAAAELSAADLPLDEFEVESLLMKLHEPDGPATITWSQVLHYNLLLQRCVR